MRKDVIIALVVVTVLIVILVAFGFAFVYPNLWGRPVNTDAYGYYVGPEMRGPGMMGSGMMGGMGMTAIYTANSQPLSEAEARNRATAYIDQYYPGGNMGDFMEFSQNYYVELQDASNVSIGELLVDRYTGVVTPEPGPNMAWNTWGRGTRTVVTYDLAEGRAQAEKFLASYLPGATIQESITYPGYYTFDFGREEMEGMLSVNAYNGYVWVHTWHGQYIGG